MHLNLSGFLSTKALRLLHMGSGTAKHIATPRVEGLVDNGLDMIIAMARSRAALLVSAVRVYMNEAFLHCDACHIIHFDHNSTLCRYLFIYVIALEARY